MHPVARICCILLLSASSTFAQSDLGSWNIINLKYNASSRWSFFGEAQLRSLKFYSNFHYYEYKGGLQFKATDQLALMLGAGSYQTYAEGGNFVTPKRNDEFRLWPQVVLSQSIGKFKIEQRYRAELRFTSDGYRNRFRYRLGITYPFGKKRDNYNPFQAGVSNELFFTNNQPYFERNRLAFTFNYKPSKLLTFQLGYVHQFDYKINDETGRDFFQTGVYLELSRKKDTPPTNKLKAE